MNTAKYVVKCDDRSRFQIDFQAEAGDVVGLRAAPDELEPILRTGQWIVLAFAVWDTKDRPAIDLACDLASRARDFRVAVRPFEFGDEFAGWVPDFYSDAGTLSVTAVNGQVAISTQVDDHPIWFAMDDGSIIAVLVGARDRTNIDNFVRKCFT